MTYWSLKQISIFKRSTVCELCHEYVVKQIQSYLLIPSEDFQVKSTVPTPLGAQHWIMIHTNLYTAFDSFYPEFGGF